MVYDGTMSGLNAAVWASNFFMPLVDSVLMLFCDADSWFSDIMDLGENVTSTISWMKRFVHTVLEWTSQRSMGTRLQRDWFRWERTFMGFRSSRYNAAKMFGWTIGDRFDLANPYRWDKVRCNYPGAVSYDPVKAWLTLT
mmetsp:Transcript_22920/g.26075  ORF Transcript_22920/g.26075 Transcript_22920/m.26075 type:complete len:140 (+) Transcript_22920:82-501(+)